MSGIHKRLHYAQKLEFELMAKCFAKYLPDEYPYEVAGADRKVLREDFDDRVDVLPVSDPNLHVGNTCQASSAINTKTHQRIKRLARLFVRKRQKRRSQVCATGINVTPFTGL